jgi:hypothetical protein
MSLAQYASPYNNDDSVETDNINANIKMTQNQNQGQNRGNNGNNGAKKIPPSSSSMRKTIKRPPAQAHNSESQSQSRVASFMSKLNAAKTTTASTSTNYAQVEDGGGMDESESDLADYHPTNSAHQMDQNQNYESEQAHAGPGSAQDDGVVTRESFEILPSTYARQYYQQYAPYSNPIASNESTADVSKDEILQKMNHIIQMLEDQQDEKTGSVTEELILYCFLGVFVIFIVDSFARAGKYVR